MDCLECYTLADQLTKGIRVADFESIITEATGTDVIRYATLQTCPLFDTKATEIEDLAPISLCFLLACSKPPRTKRQGVFIAVDMTRWQLSGPDDKSCAIDPCGLGGKVLLYYPAGASTGLLNRKQSNKCLVITKEAVPAIGFVNRANLLAAAAGMRNLVTPTTLALPKGSGRTSPRARTGLRKSRS